METIDQLHADVQRTFEAALKCADSSAKCTLAEKEALLWTKTLALGAALITLFLFRQAARPRSATYEHDGNRFVITESCRCTSIGTRFGKVPFVRPVGRQVGRRTAQADLPVDRELGLCGGFSLGVATGIARLCAMMAFAQARVTFALFHEWSPSSRATLRLVDAVGSEAKAFIEQAPAPKGDGDILVVQVDGRGAPMITATEHARRTKRRTEQDRRRTTRRAQRRARRKAHPKIRRKKGDKSKNAKVGFVAVIYTLKTTKGGLEGPINKQIIATFESHRALMLWAKREALKRGYDNKRALFIADGSEHIWRLKDELFPDAEGCLDWFHVVEKLWEIGGMLHREGSDQLRAWVAECTALLRAGKAAELTNKLEYYKRRIPKTKAKNRKRVSDIIIHLGEHLENMRYDELRRDGLDIGSGAVEGAVRNVIAVRLDGPGMRWGRERSELLLHLRCILVSGQWDAFENYLAARNGVTLRAQPIPASPYAQAA
jgi:hypothetical protein